MRFFFEKIRSRTGDTRHTEKNYKINMSTNYNKHAGASWRIIPSISGVEEEKIRGSWRQWSYIHNHFWKPVLEV
jgi:hypothetical protein